ncbi:proton-conducting transporter membrane subunit [Aliidiomarina maris]|uniref:Multicomponent Na+:H+ antiporter subunit D n=1 Tax=Aliidiomarina maris TaxID=531312 RepID=A0A327X3N4_9GAMM|nr:proton-conducting transporter membrane subunit [Aliidiomarina maris]RAK00812.1 multicomponent Na+:H+ antiporter subunit D [Aliidiomarina maris]RUO27196.1 proton-conducting membrane transporter [Aliidiomarina maris]
MNINFWLPLMVLATSLVSAIVIFIIPDERNILRGAFNLLAAIVKIAIVAGMIVGVYYQQEFETRFTLIGDIDFVLRADALSLLFAGLSSLLWLFTTIYAMGYLRGTPNRSRFFGFFSLCVASTMGIAMAGNLFTFLIFFEMLTLSTYPLVVHKGSKEALNSGRTYLIYTMAGGAVLLLGIAWLHSVVGAFDFAETGVLRDVDASFYPTLQIIFILLIAGLGVKAALVPLHGWLPKAMVAPAPVSALLHAVAVVKAGAFGIVRVIYNVYGVEFAASLQLLLPLAILASITIIYGSVQAIRQLDLKKRLAFSTVSQVSYIILGLALFGPIATVGGLVHLLHQGIMKVTLFFCAGLYAETIGVKKIADLSGAGQRMPLTSAAFTIGAFGMIGIPPTAGFVSKWYLGWGAMEAGAPWVLAVLLTSSALNAIYFLPIVHKLWFGKAPQQWPAEHIPFKRFETNPWLLWPAIITAAFSIGAGLLAAAGWSPLSWAELIAVREYLP